MSKNVEQRVAGSIVGLVVGDALGVPVEFESRESLSAKPVYKMMGYGTYNQPPGTWSDDSSMTLATIESLVSSNGYNKRDLGKKFVSWMECGFYTPGGVTFDIGVTTRHALTIGRGLDSELSNGNGSLMRMAPFAFWKGATDEVIESASGITHAHPRSVLGCLLYCDIVRELFAKKSKLSDAIEIALKKRAKHPEIEYYNRLRYLDRIAERDIESSGYIVHTLEAALWCVMNTTTYKDCVLKAVNLGKDTDTVAAVAGSIAGAIYGIAGISKSWIATLKRGNYVVETANKFEAWCNQ